MSALRSFTASVESLAEGWRASVLTDRAWKVEPGSLGTEAAPFFVNSGEIGGFAKPGRKESPTDDFPRAAHEKIAADLAYDLGLPVPPAILWEPPRKHGLPVGHLAISVVPFTSPVPWGAISCIPAEAERHLGALSRPASAMVAFDTWIGNEDRQNDGNLVLSEEATGPAQGLLRVAYIDFANSLAFEWRKNDRWLTQQGTACFPERVPLDLPTLTGMVKKIQALTESSVRQVVERIPEAFLSKGHRQLIVRGLLHRQSILPKLVSRIYPDPSWQPFETFGSP